MSDSDSDDEYASALGSEVAESPAVNPNGPPPPLPPRRTSRIVAPALAAAEQRLPPRRRRTAAAASPATVAAAKKSRTLSIRHQNNIIIGQRILVDLALLIVSIVALVAVAKAKKNTPSVEKNAAVFNFFGGAGIALSLIMGAMNGWRAIQNNRLLATE